jgi:uncharacterized protein (TIGR02145 family)
VLAEREKLVGEIVFEIQIRNSSLFGSFTDSRDGMTYKIVRIGSQIWMAENLKAIKYNDGKPIPFVKDATVWKNLTTPAYCWYDNDEATYNNPYGALYNWYIVNTGNLCPVGWHIPTESEWKKLELYLGMTQVQVDSAGDRGTIADKLKETGITHWNYTSTYWNSSNTNATNESGFTALPGGYRYYTGTD